MNKFKFYISAVLCLCTVAIGSTVDFYGSLDTTWQTVDEAHTSVLSSSSESTNVLDALKVLVYDN